MRGPAEFEGYESMRLMGPPVWPRTGRNAVQLAIWMGDGDARPSDGV